ncbi:hypothetical protein [Caulobacter hibisci]|uniref:Uncharacterized protein n=1 Tax=Caulobacter hibisci TaxID=2035993 RepID=A0ABS0SYF8_9CAUL|nr:hypothetical protein [Caulobacter hibisci]MBI1684471.1 hypothetical protein [Caulobacter hibisci]
MRGPWPITPNRITLRVCADMDWRVSAHCPGCRYSYELRPETAAGTPAGGRPIYKLLEAGAFTCRTRCGGLAASSVDVSCMDVGILRYVARFRATDLVTGVRSVQVEGPGRD